MIDSEKLQGKYLFREPEMGMNMKLPWLDNSVKTNG